MKAKTNYSEGAKALAEFSPEPPLMVTSTLRDQATMDVDQASQSYDISLGIPVHVNDLSQVQVSYKEITEAAVANCPRCKGRGIYLKHSENLYMFKKYYFCDCTTAKIRS